MDIKMFVVYFLIGGAVISTVTFFGTHAKSQVAALIAMVPAITLVSLCTIYLGAGASPAISYAKNLLKFLPAWVIYVIALIVLLPRIGLAGSAIVSVVAFLGAALLLMRLP